MKNKNKMDKLRNKMVCYYIVITAICGILNAVLDGISSVLEPIVEKAPSSVLLTAVLLLAAQVMIYVTGGLFFFIFTKKTIKQESDRQIHENSLIYAAVAHDLKTPITSIQGFSQALAEGKITEDEREEICNIIFRKSKSMNDLIDVLYEYSQLGTAEYKPDFSNVDICATLRDIIAENYSILEEKQIEPELDIPETPVMIRADKRNLSRAFFNLIINACKHNPAGIRLFVQIRKENEKCVIAIADNGTEIPPDMEIFEPFVTDNSSRTPGKGSGLGLAITKRVIEMHGGTVCLVRNPEGYTKAFVTTLKCLKTDA